MSKLYAITNQKGGVGKTTTSVCLGAALAELEKRVLAVDLDPQAGLTTSLGFDPDSFETNIYNALIDDEFHVKEIITKTKVQNFSFLPSNLDLAGAEGELIGEIGWDRTLKNTLYQIANDYDYILIDCPPSLGVLTTNALIAAQRVIIPVQSEYLALRGLKQLNRIIAKVRKKGNPELKPKILRTMHDPRTTHSSEIVEELERHFGDQVYKTIIKRTIKFADSALAGEPILIYANKSEGADAYRQLAREVLEDD
jgi:chromosome partitioning protein